MVLTMKISLNVHSEFTLVVTLVFRYRRRALFTVRQYRALGALQRPRPPRVSASGSLRPSRTLYISTNANVTNLAQVNCIVLLNSLLDHAPFPRPLVRHLDRGLSQS